MRILPSPARLLTSFFLLFSSFVFADAGLWQIEKDGKTAYLFGTVHMGDSSMRTLPVDVKEALARSKTVVVEIDIEGLSHRETQQKIVPLMLLPAGKTLKTELSPELYQKLAMALQQHQVPIQALEQLKPWAVALNITTLLYQKAGYSAEFGADLHVLKQAKSQHKTIVELETFEQQFGFFDSLTATDQHAYFIEETLKSAKDINKYVHPLFHAWKSGDLTALEAQYREAFGDAPQAKQAERILLIERNKRWLDTLLPRMDEQLFIAVGALHLPMEYGLIALFEKNGFTVKKI
jgi:uncharacterized protein YbaP (TraB family)